MADAKFVRAEGSSFYLPDTNSNERVERLAVAQMDAKLVKQMDAKLVKLGQAAQAFDGSSRVVEIATNKPIAARLFESRMRALGIRGYIRLEP